MKRFLIFLCFALLSSSQICFSQTEGYTFTITVLNRSGNPFEDVKVWLRDKNTGNEIIQRTDKSGVSVFNVPTGYWTVNLYGLINYYEFEILDGHFGKSEIQLTYNIDELLVEQELRNKRGSTKFTEIDQSDKNFGLNLEKGLCLVKIQVVNSSSRPLNSIPVSLVSVNLAKIYKSITQNTGFAIFQVPINEPYLVDIDNVRNYGYMNAIKREAIVTHKRTYEPTSIVEKDVRDTITQKITTTTKPTSARLLLDLEVFDTRNNLLANELVYLEQISTGKVYKAKTNKEGKAVFLLPKGEKYMVHFEYQKNVDVLNYLTDKGFAEASASFTYIPNPKLENPQEYIPKPGELFLEEFQHFMTKNLPEPKDKRVEMTLKWGNGNVNEQSKEAILQIGISGTSTEQAFRNVPNLDLAFVLDRSGSMEGENRIGALKRSMIKFTEQLRENDRVTLITYNDHAYVELPLQLKGNGAVLKDRINSIEAGGGTSMIEALILGYDQLLKNEKQGRAKQLFVLTDGWDGNEPQKLVEKSKEGFKQGIGISAVGVGQDYNYALLKLITSEHGGIVEYAANGNQINDAFNKQLASTMFPLAQDAKLEITFNNKIKFSQLYGAEYITSAQNKISIKIGKLYRGYNKIALAQFDLIKPDQTIENQPVTITLSYFDFITQKVQTQTEKATLTWEPATGKLQLFKDQEQKKLYSIAIMNQSIKVMVDAFAANDIPKAKNTLQRAIEQVKELFPRADDMDVRLLTTQLTDFALAINNYIKNQQKK